MMDVPVQYIPFRSIFFFFFGERKHGKTLVEYCEYEDDDEMAMVFESCAVFCCCSVVLLLEAGTERLGVRREGRIDRSIVLQFMNP